MPNSGDNEPSERRIRDMLGLIKFCLETTAKEDASGALQSNIEPMDPDRRAWLEQALKSMTVDTTRQLLENLALVKETVSQLQKDPNHNIPVQKTSSAIEVLTDLCEEIDYAVDFAKLDGFSIFEPLIHCNHEELIVKACELIAALAQNNPICQVIAMKTRLLERLIDFVDMKNEQKHIKARSYALYAISSIIRSNQEVREHFETQIDGLTALLHLMDYQQLDQMLDSKSRSDESRGSSVYWWRKLRIRSVFLFQTLCSESAHASNFFFEKQAMKQLSDQLRNSHDPEIREHLLLAMKVFLQSLDTSKRVEALNLCPDLKATAKEIQGSSLTESFSDFDLTDTRSTCEDLINLIDALEKQ